MTIFGKILLGLILVTAAVLIIKGAGKNDPVAMPNAEEDASPDSGDAVTNEEELGTFKGSSAELMARGGNHKCTFAQEVENSKTLGTVYVSNAKMRGDFKTDVNASGAVMSVESHMISDGEFIWTWSGIMPTGMKMKIDQSVAIEGSPQQSFDTNQELEYLCVDWTPDESQFTLPSAVTFTEIKS